MRDTAKPPRITVECRTKPDERQNSLITLRVTLHIQGMKCTYCDQPSADLNLCTDCGRSYCKTDSTNGCMVCHGNLLTVQVTSGDWEGQALDWLKNEETKIGLVGFDAIPPLSRSLLKAKPQPELYKTILFPTKAASNAFAKAVNVRWGRTELLDLIYFSESSRYYALIGDDPSRRALLFNCGALDIKSISFLTRFFDKLFATARPLDPALTKNVAKTLYAVVGSYNLKSGISFVQSNEHLVALLNGLSQNLAQDFWEYRALNGIISKEDAEPAIDYASKKINLIFDTIHWSDVDYFDEILQLFSKYVFVASILAATASLEVVHAYATREFSRRHQECVALLGDRKDAVRALEELQKSLSDQKNFASLTTFVVSMCGYLLTAVEKLEARYLRLDEAAALTEVTTEYSQKIESGGWYSTPQFGSVEAFAGTLNRVFMMKGGYPEIRVIAGLCLLEILRTIILFRNDRGAFIEAESKQMMLVDLADSEFTRIRKINPQTMIKPLDVGQGIGILATFALMFGNQPKAKALLLTAIEYAERNDIQSLKIQLYWQKFLVTHDYDFLGKIVKIPDSNTENLEAYEVHSNVISLLSKGLLEESGRELHFDTAEQIAFGAADIPGKWTVSMALSLSAARILYQMSRLFRQLLIFEASGQISELRIAQTEAGVLLQDLSTVNPARTLVFKTKAICDIWEGNILNLQNDLNKLGNFTEADSELDKFMRLVKSWTTAQTEGRKSRVRWMLDSDVDPRDIWSRLAAQYIRNEIHTDLNSDDFSDYETIVFVEGLTDELVYHRFQLQVRPALRAAFIGAEGWTNMDYYANAKVVARLGKPLTVIFDGDTDDPDKREIKARLVQEIGIPKDRIITLGKPSVEHYLLNARAIKAAFPGIEMSESAVKAYLENFQTKKSQKEAFDQLLKRNNIGKYGPEKAKLIAEQMTSAEVAQELQTIIMTLPRT